MTRQLWPQSRLQGRCRISATRRRKSGCGCLWSMAPPGRMSGAFMSIRISRRRSRSTRSVLTAPSQRCSTSKETARSAPDPSTTRKWSLHFSSIPEKPRRWSCPTIRKARRGCRCRWKRRNSFAGIASVAQAKNYAFYGMMLVMFALVSAALLVMRQPVFAAFAGYLLSMLTYISHSDGVAFQYVWSNYPQFNSIAAILAGSSVLVFGGLFAMAILQTSRFHPVMHRVLIAAVASVLSVNAVFLTTNPQLLNRRPCRHALGLHPDLPHRGTERRAHPLQGGPLFRLRLDRRLHTGKPVHGAATSSGSNWNSSRFMTRSALRWSSRRC